MGQLALEHSFEVPTGKPMYHFSVSLVQQDFPFSFEGEIFFFVDWGSDNIITLSLGILHFMFII